MVIKIADACYTSSTGSSSSNKSNKNLQLEEYVGNAKRITIKNNQKHLRIIGNGNRVFVHLNAGKLEIIGNSNRVRIFENCATARIKYIGNNGRIYLCNRSGSGSSETTKEKQQPPQSNNVRYSGVNGCVRLVSEDDFLKKSKANKAENNVEKSTSMDKKSSPASPSTSSPPPPPPPAYGLSQDDLTNKFNKKFQRVIAAGDCLIVNNMNMSLQDLCDLRHLSIDSRPTISIGTTAQSNLVINDNC